MKVGMRLRWSGPPAAVIFQRAFWAFMFLAHMPGWASAAGCAHFGEGVFEPTRCLILTFSQILFLLKLLDVGWLRLPTDGRIWLIVCVSFALLHARVVPRVLPAVDEIPAAVLPVALLSLGAVLVGAVLRQLVRSRSVRARTRSVWHVLLERTWEAAWRPAELLKRAHLALRAPPA